MAVPPSAHRPKGKLEATAQQQGFTPGLTCGPVLCQRCSQWPDSTIQCSSLRLP